MVTRDLGLGDVFSRCHHSFRFVNTVVTHPSVKLHVPCRRLRDCLLRSKSLRLTISGNATDSIRLKIMLTVSSLDQRLSLIIHALHGVEKIEQLIVARARKVAVSAREGFAFAVSVESLSPVLA